jgi:hypothetical protein
VTNFKILASLFAIALVAAAFWVTKAGKSSSKHVSEISQSSEYRQPASLLPAVEKTPGGRATTPPLAEGKVALPTATEAAAATATKPAQEEKSRTWVPDRVMYLSDIPAQKNAEDFFKKLGELKFAPKDPPRLVGTNEDGFEQYEYDAEGAQVTQWKRSNETSVEEIKLDNGDTIIRRLDPNDHLPPEISYRQKDGSYQQIIYRRNGTIDHIKNQSGDHTEIYYYDEQGRVTEIYSE